MRSMSAYDQLVQTLPHDKFAEQAILGAIILRNEVLNEVAGILIASDFFSPAHQYVYKSMLEMSDQGQPIDEVTLGGFLQKKQLMEKAGGVDYIIALTHITPTTDNVDHYVQIVRERSQLRQLITTTSLAAKQGREFKGGVEEIMSQVSESLREIESRATSATYTPLGDILLNSFDELEKRTATPGALTGAPSGFTELDKLTHGLQGSDLIILAARPSMGKTALALNIASYAAMNAEVPTLVFSLEMPKEHLAMRVLCSTASIDSHKLRIGDLSEQDWEKLSIAIADMMDSKIFIDDLPAITTLHIKNIARQVQNKFGLGLIVVDYLQLMRTPNKPQSREQEISEISRSLKALAKEFNVPVLALSQLNRDLERRQDKRPIMADLRESGAIEQDADLIMFIYRDEVYNEDTEDQGIAELIVAKHRNGATGTVRLAFVGMYTKFANLSLRENF